MEKSVQISYELFIQLARYHLVKNMEEQEQLERSIVRGLERKIDAMARHEQYTRYKTSANGEERERARQEYLDMIGLHKDFRW